MPDKEVEESEQATDFLRMLTEEMNKARWDEEVEAEVEGEAYNTTQFEESVASSIDRLRATQREQAANASAAISEEEELKKFEHLFTELLANQASGEGATKDEAGLSGMLDSVMASLMSKDILLEPMKELALKVL